MESGRWIVHLRSPEDEDENSGDALLGITSGEHELSVVVDEMLDIC